ncbi:MAG: TRAFs-binding domain-containing protein, partial [Planctomycetota bacterium]
MTATTVEMILAELASSQRAVPETLNIYKHERHEPLWRSDPRLHRAFAKKLIDGNHLNRAYELVRDGLQEGFHSGDLRLKYLAALALARSGNVSKATALADELLASPGVDDAQKCDALSLKGRLQKDLYQRTGDAAHASKSADFYQEAFALSNDWFPGINTATMSLLAGDAVRAAQIAATVIELAAGDLNKPGGDRDYWLAATLGEAHMIRGELKKAREFYEQAVRIALEAQDEGNVASMRRQVQLVAKKLLAAESLLGIFHLGNIVVFAGHLLDHP